MSAVAALPLVPESPRGHLGEPSYFAFVAGELTVVAVFALRALGVRGSLLEQLVIATFLAGMPSVYIANLVLHGGARGVGNDGMGWLRRVLRLGSSRASPGRPGFSPLASSRTACFWTCGITAPHHSSRCGTRPYAWSPISEWVCMPRRRCTHGKGDGRGGRRCRRPRTAGCPQADRKYADPKLRFRRSSRSLIGSLERAGHIVFGLR